MQYLNNYIAGFEAKGSFKQAVSIKKTAAEVGQKYLSKFDYTSNQIGLLLGNIQSGKTGQMFGIASEAADRGFRFFLLLETDSTLLQEQTYERAKRDLPDFVVCSENEEQKFRNHGTAPVMIVIKKNSRILKSWADRFKNTKMLLGNPLFILDDEADAVSLNTKVNQRTDNDEKKQSTINKYLKDIRNTALSSIFLQITGTPQAVFLQSKESNWQPEFTYYFEPGEGYLGGNFFFPDSTETPDFIRFTDGKTPQEVAKEAVLRHLVVSAQVLLSGGKVSNCIIHPGIRQNTHTAARDDVTAAFAWWGFHHDGDEFSREFDREYNSLKPVKTEKRPHDEILEKVLSMLEKGSYSILMLNGTSTDSSEDYAEGCNFIIGGTNLGRGVTFGQLNTFVYTRTSQNPQADTMWQHQRMFGYDRDPGLISMYSSRELYKLFSEINSTNNSIINQVKQGNSVRVAYPDGLNPTRSNVLDKSLLNIVPGGSHHFPINPVNDTYEEIQDIVARFGNTDSVCQVSLEFIIEILKHISTEKSFNMDGYIQTINSKITDDRAAQGGLLVRRNRDITHATRALLSPNDWSESNKLDDKFVLTLYSVLGQKEKGWNGSPVWVPDIKFPKAENFYMII
ncbi:helicase [Levilactobacillus brevis]|nr:helicase [Levilactobacillus brevis]